MEEGRIDVDAVEKAAYDLLARVPEFVWDGESLPVPVDSIVDNVLGLRVRLAEDMTSAPGCEELPSVHLSGLLLTDFGEIWVNADEAERWPARRRFTIGHEVGHYLLHQDEAPRIFCRSGYIVDAEEDAQAPPPKPFAESEADAFAAALLMPEHLIRPYTEKHGRDVETIQEVFDCSHKATNYRLNALDERGF
ncbi:MAG: ImmA/IrrE family metallo-endopeptidase [Solirubrobacterales bacterium]